MEDADIAPIMYIRLIQLEWTESRASELHTFQYSAQARLSALTDWISCTYVIGAISYRLPFCVLIYIGTLSMVPVCKMYNLLAGDLVQSRDFHYSVEPVYRRPREVVTYHREDSLELNTYVARSRPGFNGPIVPKKWRLN